MLVQKKINDINEYNKNQTNTKEVNKIKHLKNQEIEKSALENKTSMRNLNNNESETSTLHQETSDEETNKTMNIIDKDVNITLNGNTDEQENNLSRNQPW